MGTPCWHSCQQHPKACVHLQLGRHQGVEPSAPGGGGQVSGEVPARTGEGGACGHRRSPCRGGSL